MDNERIMTQEAPWPHALEAMVEKLRHRKRYDAHLQDIDRGQGCKGLTLVVYITEPDAYHPEKMRNVMHYFPVPAAAYDYRSWRRWLFEQLHAISLHEDMEAFTIDGEKPYAPDHKPGRDPYTVVERGTWEDADTSFRGERNHPGAPIKCANCEREGHTHYCYSVEEMKAHLKEHRDNT